MDANPYGNRYQFGVPPKWAIHTGADLNLNNPIWNADANSPARSIADGLVIFAQLVVGSTWGRLVVIRHILEDGSVVHSRCGHLRTLAVSAGQTVIKGQILGTIGGIEYNVPDHLHFDISLSGILETNPKYWPGDNLPAVKQHFVEPKGWLQGRIGLPVPPTPQIDLLPYLRGDGRLYEVKNATGGQERFQTQATGGKFYQTKNAAWEELYYNDTYIFRDIDTSPGGGRYYRLKEGAALGSIWIPRFWQVGGIFSRDRYVQFYDKATCQPSAENSGPVTDTMRFNARYSSYTFRTGITLPDVIELLWANGGELYFYCKGFGLVGWEREHFDPDTPEWSAISEIHAPGTRPDNIREVIPCLG